MNLDLLIKLCKLANNNPNDNEANLAARKVCKMIAEANYKFTPEQPKVTIRPQGPYQPGSNPGRAESPFEEFFRRYSGAGSPFNRHQDFYEEVRRAEQQSRQRGTSWSDPFTKASKPTPEKRMRTCSKCGASVLTARVTNVFTCNKCEWINYDSETKP